MSEGFIKIKFSGAAQDTSACCSPAADNAPANLLPRVTSAPWITGSIKTPAGDVPVVGTGLGTSDRLGAWKARWGIGRMRYTVEPGLYAVGSPAPESPVLVSANYKMSFDRLRSSIQGLDAWILVLDTKGINVWCAAGKGTFGTEELVRRSAGLDRVVSHRRLILPQLGAPGVSAHEVRERTGFRVVYGPVSAGDIPAFLDAGMKATPEMRRVRFSIKDRLPLIPMEMVPGARYTIPVAVALFFLAGLGPGGYAFSQAVHYGTLSVVLLLSAFIGGTVVSPALLPWIPGRAFSLKGALVGLCLALLLWVREWSQAGAFMDPAELVAWSLIMPSVSSFFAMNFTGSSTYTSLSGVKREMRIAVPVQAVSAIAGLGLWVAGLLV